MSNKYLITETYQIFYLKTMRNRKSASHAVVFG